MGHARAAVAMWARVAGMGCARTRRGGGGGRVVVEGPRVVLCTGARPKLEHENLAPTRQERALEMTRPVFSSRLNCSAPSDEKS